MADEDLIKLLSDGVGAADLPPGGAAVLLDDAGVTEVDPVGRGREQGDTLLPVNAHAGVVLTRTVTT